MLKRFARWRYIVPLALLAWMFWCGFTLWTLRTDAHRGTDLLREARAEMTPATLVRGASNQLLAQAHAHFASAADAGGSPSVAPLRWLPFVGRQLRSATSLAEAATEVSDAGMDAITAFRKALDSGVSDGQSRIALTRDVARIARNVRGRLDAVDPGPSKGLIATLADGRRQFVDERAGLRRDLNDLMTAATGLREFLVGPSRYLMFAANSGEMRAGSGMPLSAGVLTVQDGRLHLDDMQSVVDMRLPKGLVTPTGDLQTLWGWTEPGREWRNLAMTPRFDATAELAAEMWRARTGIAVDGVLMVDPVALKAILAATGAVDVEGTTFTADNVLHELLVQQYWGVDPTNWQGDLNGNDARRERLGVIAHAALDRVEAGGWDMGTLLDGLISSTRARHILAWSAHSTQMDAWRAVGATGELSSTSIALSLISQGGTKLDEFVDINAGLSRQGDDVVLSATITDNAPEGLPPYVAGPSNFEGISGVGVDEGAYAGILSLNVPGAASLPVIEGVDAPLVAGVDGPTRMTATRIHLERGESTTVRFRFRLPEGVPLLIEPSARIALIHWRSGLIDWWDDQSALLNIVRR